MGSLKIWSRVPDQARLEIWVESDDSTFVTSARLLDDRGNEEEWTDAQLVPGPKRKTVRAPRDWTARVRVAFTGSETARATIRARLQKPGGSSHGRAYSYQVSGRSGDIRRATICVVTRKS